MRSTHIVAANGSHWPQKHLFAGSEAGVERAAIIYSLVASWMCMDHADSNSPENGGLYSEKTIFF
jgi:hypothetical protein